MPPPSGSDTRPAPADRQNLYVYNGGFLTQARVRRILDLSGYDIRIGAPGPGDMVGVWGQSPTAPRGEAVAERRNSPILRVEDAFLRSVLPGRAGAPALGLFLDSAGVHFDAKTPSALEQMLATDALDDTALLNRARVAVERLQFHHLSKYNAFDPDLAVPEPGYVLVIDQSYDDASVLASGGTKARFREMLAFAEIENPGARILVKSHPDTLAGLREGYFSAQDVAGRAALFTAPVSPWKLLEGAVAVYTWSSQMGFEAIFAGHNPRVFGQPIYAGWGLTRDENPPPQRSRKLTRAQLFAAVMIKAATWYDPYRDKLCTLEQVIDTLEAQARAWRDDHQGWHAAHMSRWKHRHMQQFFGKYQKVTFSHSLPPAPDKPRMAWASKTTPAPDLTLVEDGFLRSRGLGAKLIPPLSLALDDLGIYYDPSQESRLEHLISSAPTLPGHAVERAARLIRRLEAEKLTKYNLPAGDMAELPPGHRILVPGQVEDDASILRGCPNEDSNLALLKRCRAETPNAVILYKPHPDVSAGLRRGALSQAEARQYADVILEDANPAQLIDQVTEVWTLTSLLGFEALLRGRAVTCLGQPFYAGWGLTRDLGPPIPRRTARPDLTALVHAVLIAYPRYLDPVTGLPCPVEVAAERLATGALPPRSPLHGLAAKLQSLIKNRRG